MKNRLHGLALVALAGLMGCSDQSDGDEVADDSQIASQEVVPPCVASDGGVSTSPDAGAVIDASVTLDAGAASACASLTYASFGKPFLQKYCVGCHTGAAASDGVDLSSLAGVKTNKREVDAHAVRTPRTKPMPPPGMPQPTAEERKKLGEWLTCGPN